MSSASTKIIQAAAGNADKALYVEDVFSTYLYDGNSSTQTITNGIDLAGEGGLVWISTRNNAGGGEKVLVDTERGATKRLRSYSTDSEATDSTGLTSFNSNGFTLGNDSGYNYSTGDYVSWTFRKAPKFFDVVTYTGNNVAGRTVSHNLGSVPGCIIVKAFDGSSYNWAVYHRGVNGGVNPENYVLFLNATMAKAGSNSVFWGGTAPTSTTFSVGNYQNTNQSGKNFVAYLFAHNNSDGEYGDNSDQDIIKCGSYTGNGSSNGPEIDLGFEPQWILIKNTVDGTDGWVIVDNMRGMVANGSDKYLFPNDTSSESSNTLLTPTATGFKINQTFGLVNGSGEELIYIAIRRGLMKTPESGTEVFAVDSGGNGDSPSFISNFPVDLGIRHPDRDQAGNGTYWSDRLRGNKYLKADSTAAEATITGGFDQMDGFQTYSALSDAVGWMFRRAPGFFDVVAYTGDGVAGLTIDHNLGVKPELMIVKGRNNAFDWNVYVEDLGFADYMELNKTNANSTHGNVIWYAEPTASSFSVGTNAQVNQSTYNYIAYLFATVPGISKVGSYTGTGSSQTIDCGFSAGARFVLIRRTDISDNWEVFDTERGIVAGNDPRIILEDTAPQLTSKDFVDPDSAGFAVTTELSKSGGNYIFLAIA